MRMSRTNFYPILDSDEEDDVHPSCDSHEINDLDVAPAEAVANDDQYRPRFRSPALRGYDPGQYADGTWESHFYLAPNVRFTRTPDKAARIEEEAAAEPIIMEPVPAPREMQAESSPVQSVSKFSLPQPPASDTKTPPLSQAELLLRLREALDERRRRVEDQQAAAPADPVPQFVQAVVNAAQDTVPADAPVVFRPAVPAAKASVSEAISRFAHLSDHAFWETMVPEERVIAALVRAAVSVVRMPPPVATVEEKRQETASVA